VGAETHRDGPPATGSDALLRESSSTPIDATAQTVPGVSAAVTSGQRKSTLNFGTIVFATFSLLSLVVCIVKGIVPIYAGESVLWGILAWYCYKKSPLSQNANLIVLLLAVVVAAGEGYMFSRGSRDSFTYLTQGKLQYRVNARNGRTDMMLSTGRWHPVSFDRPSEEIPYSASLNVTFSRENWGPSLRDLSSSYEEFSSPNHPQDICMDVQNNSRFVLEKVTILISLDPESSDKYDHIVELKDALGRLLDRGEKSKFCGPAPLPLSNSKWSDSYLSVNGWKD
jgi:hypothetical protein